MKIRNLAVAAITASALIVAGITPAFASNTEVTVSGTNARATLVSPHHAMRYTENEILTFLVLGEGRVATENPDLATYLGFNPTPDEPGIREVAEALIKGYQTANPALAKRVTRIMQSGDPTRVDAVLAAFAKSFNDYVAEVYKTQIQSAPEYSTQGSVWWWTDTWAVTLAVAAAEGAVIVGGVVGGLHIVLAVTVLVYVYLPGMEGNIPPLERDRMISHVTKVLGA